MPTLNVNLSNFYLGHQIKAICVFVFPFSPRMLSTFPHHRERSPGTLMATLTVMSVMGHHSQADLWERRVPPLEGSVQAVSVSTESSADAGGSSQPEN